MLAAARSLLGAGFKVLGSGPQALGAAGATGSVPDLSPLEPGTQHPAPTSGLFDVGELRLGDQFVVKGLVDDDLALGHLAPGHVDDDLGNAELVQVDAFV